MALLLIKLIRAQSSTLRREKAVVSIAHIIIKDVPILLLEKRALPEANRQSVWFSIAVNN